MIFSSFSLGATNTLAPQKAVDPALFAGAVCTLRARGSTEAEIRNAVYTAAAGGMTDELYAKVLAMANLQCPLAPEWEGFGPPEPEPVPHAPPEWEGFGPPELDASMFVSAVCKLRADGSTEAEIRNAVYTAAAGGMTDDLYAKVLDLAKQQCPRAPEWEGFGPPAPDAVPASVFVPAPVQIAPPVIARIAPTTPPPVQTAPPPVIPTIMPPPPPPPVIPTIMPPPPIVPAEAATTPLNYVDMVCSLRAQGGTESEIASLVQSTVAMTPAEYASVLAAADAQCPPAPKAKAKWPWIVGIALALGGVAVTAKVLSDKKRKR